MAILNIPGYGNVSYGECPGSPKESCQNGQWVVRRDFITAWTDRWLFMLGMLGNAVAADSIVNPIQSINRIIPHGFATQGIGADNKKWLFATQIASTEPMSPFNTVAGGNFKDSFDVANYRRCKISVNYEAPTFTILSDADMIQQGYVLYPGTPSPDESTLQRFVTKFRQPTAEYLTLPYNAYRFAIVDGQNTHFGRELVRGSNGRIISAKEMVYIWHMVPSIPVDYAQYMGTVNNAVFDTFQAGTLLLTGVEIKPYRWFPTSDNFANGARLFDITYKMKYFSAVDPATGKEYDALPIAAPSGVKRGHNYFLRYNPDKLSAPPTYEYISNAGGQLGDMSPNQPFNLQLLNISFPDPTPTGIGLYSQSTFSNLFTINKLYSSTF